MGAGVVGFLTAVLGAPGLFAILFGYWSLAVALITVIFLGSVAGLALLYRHTGGQGPAWRWAGTVTVSATVLAAGSALAWQLSGGTFGRSPVVWQAAVAGAFVACAGVATRATRLPAAAIALGVVLAAATQLGPALASWFDPPTARGCIAATAEEAAARCP